MAATLAANADIDELTKKLALHRQQVWFLNRNLRREAQNDG
jgi:hypothetical protein